MFEVQAQYLQNRQTQQLLRTLPSEKIGIDLSSNDYVGLAQNPWLKAALAQFPGTQIGSTGSRLLSGNHPLATTLEKRLQAYFHAPAALLFTGGYAANIGLLSALPQRKDRIFYDEESHACSKEGARLSPAKYHKFKHNDPEDLRRKLEKYPAQTAYVVAEGIHSMRGDKAPLKALLAVCAAHNACLILDEAHSTGICGGGKGLAYEVLQDQLLHQENLIRVHTFGKAWGLQGACVVGHPTVIAYLINAARSFIYTTAPTAVLLWLLHKALDFFEHAPFRFALTALQAHIRFVEDHLQSKPLPYARHTPTHTPIQPLLIGSAAHCTALSHYLAENHYPIPPIRYPTVPQGEAQLRICLHSFNTKAEITQLLNLLHAWQPPTS